MSVVRAAIDIDATPQEIWDVIMDPKRFGEWVTIHRKLCHADDGRLRTGFQVEQRLALRGAPFTVHWTLTECDSARLGTWEGTGPAGSYARVTNRLSELGGHGTHLEYENEFEAPGGRVGRFASRVLVGGMPEREADKSLKRLKALLEKR
ncbi:MAG: SRPBCC family protein [Actinomycetota bacterium]|nr:SRPBCC family protein [Actinomycetota bacterium]